ncbi:MAG: hypothetical protein ACWGON_07530 [Gemmatimonadota bacterium]
MIRNFLARVGCLTLIAVIGFGVWYFRDDIATRLGRVEVVARSSEPSEDLARRAEQKLNSLSREGPSEVTFSESELQSLLTYRAAPYFPRGLEDPIVDVRDSTIVISALVRPGDLEEYAPPEIMQQFLSDTSRVVATIVPGLRRPGMGQVTVTSLQAGALVVPAIAVPFILQSLEIPGMDASGSDILIPLSTAVTGVSIGDASLTIRMDGSSE